MAQETSGAIGTTGNGKKERKKGADNARWESNTSTHIFTRNAYKTDEQHQLR